MKSVIDVYSKGEYPSCELSNFAEHTFWIDNVECLSMEGFLQSLKFKNVQKQNMICKLSGKEAKNSTKHTFSQLRWKLSHNLYWQGQKINRFSDEYQKLLDKAYMKLSGNDDFQKALESSVGFELIHSIGKSNEKETILTEYEYISRLIKLREKMF